MNVTAVSCLMEDSFLADISHPVVLHSFCPLFYIFPWPCSCIHVSSGPQHSVVTCSGLTVVSMSGQGPSTPWSLVQGYHLPMLSFSSYLVTSEPLWELMDTPQINSWVIFLLSLREFKLNFLKFVHEILGSCGPYMKTFLIPPVVATPLLPALGRLRQKDNEFRDALVYSKTLSQKNWKYSPGKMRIRSLFFQTMRTWFPALIWWLTTTCDSSFRASSAF